MKLIIKCVGFLFVFLVALVFLPTTVVVLLLYKSEVDISFFGFFGMYALSMILSFGWIYLIASALL